VAIVALVLVVGVIYRRDLWKNVQPLYTDTGTYHLGDETIKNWSNLYGNCFEAEFSLNWPIKNLALQLETYGVENSSIKLNGRRVASLPPQPIQPGTGRPNYWSSERSVPLPTYVLNPSLKNTLALCSEPVADPQFSGDLDDFQFRNLKITAEK
jgi:hypothetical protein